MDKFIDLTRTLTHKLPVFPGDDQLKLFRSRRLAFDGYNDHRIEMGMHAGTHIDGPMHLLTGQRYLSSLSASNFIAPGCLLDFRNHKTLRWRAEMERTVTPKSIVLLLTGHDRCFGDARYFTDYPVIAPQLARFFINTGIKMLGMDSPSPDRPPYPMHKLLLKNGIYLIENLIGLERLAGINCFEVIALPLKIKADSAPARVLVRIA